MKKNKFHLTAVEVGKRIQWPVETWPGNCFAVASKMVTDKVVKGVAVYGHWLGPIARKTMFYGKPLVQHGWIVQKDGTVIDPTRYVFEGVEPYIFVGHPDDAAKCDEEHRHGFFRPCKIGQWPYDEGGNKLRSAMMTPPPDFSPAQKTYQWSPKNKRLSTAVDILLDGAARCAGLMSQHQLHWLANLPYDMLTPVPGLDLAPDLYKELKKLGMLAHVPIDNQRRAERRHVKGT